MSFEYIKKHYGIQLKRGGEVRVRDTGELGKITSHRNYIKVVLDQGPNFPLNFHPFDLDYLYLNLDTGAQKEKHDARIERFNDRLNGAKA